MSQRTWHARRTGFPCAIPRAIVSTVTASLLVCACQTVSLDGLNGKPAAAAYARLGQPGERYTLADGTTRLLWPTRPNGETSTAIDVDRTGKIVNVAQVMDVAYFAQAGVGTWTRQDVLAHFGEPVRRERFGLSHQDAWTYRYMAIGNRFMLYTFLFDDTGILRKTQTEPDPRHDPAAQMDG